MARLLRRLRQAARKRLLALAGAGLGCLAVLAWMLAAGAGYGPALLRTGPKNNGRRSSISVKPGNATVRRNSDQLIFAHVTGIQPGDAHLFARFQGSTEWEPVTMRASPDAGGGFSYRFIFAGVPESVEYYVTAGSLTSPRYRLRVFDQPLMNEAKLIYGNSVAP